MSKNKNLSMLFSKLKRRKTPSGEIMSIEERRKFIINEKTSFQVKEAYKTLRTNILFSLPEEGCNKIIITSSLPGEGKSTTCVNAAITFAESSKKILIIDCDLRRPNISNLLDIPLKPGLTNVLVRMNTFEEVIRKNVRPNLDVLTAGDVPPNPSELLGSNRMKKVIDTLSEQYDYIFIDSPPVLSVTDTAILTRYCTGVLFIARYNETDKNAVSSAIEQLMLANAKILGGVFNGFNAEEDGYKHSYNKYGGKYRYSKYYYKDYQ